MLKVLLSVLVMLFDGWFLEEIEMLLLVFFFVHLIQILEFLMKGLTTC